MWSLYIFMSVLAAGVVLKLVHPLMGKGRFRQAGPVTKGDARLVYGLVATVPTASLFLYLMTGSPELRGQQAAFYDLAEQDKRHFSLLAEKPVETLVTKNPHDIGALTALAEINLRLGRSGEAARFFGRAREEAAAQGDWRERLIAVAEGEAQVAANGGQVGEDAAKTFSHVLTLHPENPFARFYLAQRKAEQGDVDTAIAELTALLNEGAPEKFWKQKVREKIAELRRAKK